MWRQQSTARPDGARDAGLGEVGQPCINRQRPLPPLLPSTPAPKPAAPPHQYPPAPARVTGDAARRPSLFRGKSLQICNWLPYLYSSRTRGGWLAAGRNATETRTRQQQPHETTDLERQAVRDACAAVGKPKRAAGDRPAGQPRHHAERETAGPAAPDRKRHRRHQVVPGSRRQANAPRWKRYAPSALARPATSA